MTEKFEPVAKANVKNDGRGNIYIDLTSLKWDVDDGEHMLFTAAQMRQARVMALEEALILAKAEAEFEKLGHAYYKIKALIEQESILTQPDGEKG